jgi:uncharacterized MAPEG superfamily protein
MAELSEAARSFLTLGGWSVLLLLAHILLQGQFATKELGLGWNAGPRDGNRKPEGQLAGRAERASFNFRETYPAFVLLVLGLAISGEDSWLGLTGGWLWFAARVVYYPLYLAGIPFIRSLVWLVSLVGLLMMLGALLF